jgi:hypothetical protein
MRTFGNRKLRLLVLMALILLTSVASDCQSTAYVGVSYGYPGWGGPCCWGGSGWSGGVVVGGPVW